MLSYYTIVVSHCGALLWSLTNHFSRWMLSLMHRVDEKPGDSWDLPRVSIDALGAAMLVTILLDLWRLCLGPIVPIPESKQCPQSGLPWFPMTSWRISTHETPSVKLKSEVQSLSWNDVDHDQIELLLYFNQLTDILRMMLTSTLSEHCFISGFYGSGKTVSDFLVPMYFFRATTTTT